MVTSVFPTTSLLMARSTRPSFSQDQRKASSNRGLTMGAFFKIARAMAMRCLTPTAPALAHLAGARVVPTASG